MSRILAQRKYRQYTAPTICPAEKTIDELLSQEWLLANDRGGYSSSTVICCNTRRYHGLLIGSLRPPTNRIMALAGCIESVSIGGQRRDLSTFEFDGTGAPEGFRDFKGFTRDFGANFSYSCDGIGLTKSVYLLPDSDTVLVVYRVDQAAGPVEMTIRPLVGLRDFHSLQNSSARMICERMGSGSVIRHDVADSCRLLISCSGTALRSDPQWWYRFVYRCDRERGQDFTEDLWSPGTFVRRLQSGQQICLWATLADAQSKAEHICPDVATVRRMLSERQKKMTAWASGDRNLKLLSIAADQFIVQRAAHDGNHTTILAGYPWFADWGRDAFIALPGLLIATRRLQEAASVLLTFAASVSEGMIPNCFDDYGHGESYNSIDASLWFIHAAFEYLKAGGRRETFCEELLPNILSIVGAYQRGTQFGIRADADGLITGGDAQTQLTWMDARCGDIVFTPRYGKAVEVNALWFNALMNLARFYTDSSSHHSAQQAEKYRRMAGLVKGSFSRLFWNESSGFLNDCILPDGAADSSLRPNQIFAVSLPFSPLALERQKAVVQVIEKTLLTPYGLRTLGMSDPRYVGCYSGPPRCRDGAYHQGTVWAYLIGPFVEAYLKVNNFSRESRGRAAGFLEPLLSHLACDACVGQVSEIFDADPPFKAKGCFAQAWSVAELIRAYLLIKS